MRKIGETMCIFFSGNRSELAEFMQFLQAVNEIMQLDAMFPPSAIGMRDGNIFWAFD